METTLAVCAEVCQAVSDFIEENFSQYIEQAKELIHQYGPIVMEKITQVTESTIETAFQTFLWIAVCLI